MNDLHFAFPGLCIAGAIALIIALTYRMWMHKAPTYSFALSHYMAQHKVYTSRAIKFIFFLLRLSILSLLVFLIGKPQLPDKRTHINVEGIDIVLVLDASGSMACFDDLNDRRQRMHIAKEEALRFIGQRENDNIGIVTFANGALTACPLTHDKAVLTEIINNISIGSMVDDRATLLSYGMLTALNRLKNSDSPSKIMIVLTDGQPSIHDAPIHIPISIARQLGVKMYTIGIGNQDGGYCAGPHGIIIPQGAQLNESLLVDIAQQTGGNFYRARNAAEIRTIYKKIDQLEKKNMPVNLYTHYQDIFEPFLWFTIILLIAELLCATFVWKML